jgi:hypothetical protein
MTREEFFEKYDWYIEAIKNEEAVEVSNTRCTWEKRLPVGFNFTQNHPFKTALSQFRYARKPKPKKYRVKPWPEIAMWLCDNFTGRIDNYIRGDNWDWNLNMKKCCGGEVVSVENGPYRYKNPQSGYGFLPEWVEEIKE